MTTPTTLADWVDHCRQQADWEAEDARVQDADGHPDAADQASARAKDWRALADLVDAARNADWYLDEPGAEGRLIAAVARIAAHLPIADDRSTQPVDLDAIERRATDATPAPWQRVGPPWLTGDNPTYVIAGDPDPHRGRFVCDMANYGEEDNPNDGADAEFIAHARTDVPALVARVRELETERDRLRGELERARADGDEQAVQRLVLHRQVAQARRY